MPCGREKRIHAAFPEGVVDEVKDGGIPIANHLFQIFFIPPFLQVLRQDQGYNVNSAKKLH